MFEISGVGQRILGSTSAGGCRRVRYRGVCLSVERCSTMTTISVRPPLESRWDMSLPMRQEERVACMFVQVCVSHAYAHACWRALCVHLCVVVFLCIQCNSVTQFYSTAELMRTHFLKWQVTNACGGES